MEKFETVQKWLYKASVHITGTMVQWLEHPHCSW